MSAVPGGNMSGAVGSHKKQCNSASLEGTHPLTPTFTGHNGIFVFLLLPNSLALDTEPPGLLYITH